MSTADLALYIATTTVLLTAVTGFLVPESAAYTDHSKQRLAAQPTQAGVTGSAIDAIQAGIQGIQERQNAMAAHFGITPAPAAQEPSN